MENLWRIFSEKTLSEKNKSHIGDPLGFFNIHSVAKHQKIVVETIWRIFFQKKSHNAEKLKGGPLDSSGMVCYAEKEEKLFWFSSLGQMIQFGSIKFCRTFKNYFGQFVWIEKKESL